MGSNWNNVFSNWNFISLVILTDGEPFELEAESMRVGFVEAMRGEANE